MTLSSSVQRYYNSCVITKSYEQKKLQLQSELQLYIYDCMANGTKDTGGILVHKEPAISIVIPLDLRTPVSAKIYKYTY